MDEIGLNELLQLIIKEKGGTPQQYNKMMDYIAFHETGHKQRMDPKAKQISGNEEDGFYDGPGRGLFQFEVGEKKGGNTAVNRTVRYFKDNNLTLPKWLHDVSMGSAGSKSVDVSDLSADQQKMLFLGYHKGHPVSDFSKVWNNEQTIQDFWAENHWAGDKENLTAKLALFNKNITAKDSIDALNIRKAELFGQDDKVPFQSAQKDPNRLPTESDIFKSIFGQQDSSLVKEYDHGGKHFDFSKTTDYSGENLKDDWLWKNVSQPFVKATTWLGETAIPKNFEELMLMTGGGAAIGGIAKHAPKLGRYFSKEIKEGIKEGKKLWGNPTIDAASIGKNRVSAVQDVIDKNRNYLLSEEYMTKRMANTGESKSQVTKEINKYLRELKGSNISQASIESKPGSFTKGQYQKTGPSSAKITINREVDDIDQILQTIDHETKHLLSPVAKVASSPYGETNIFGKINPKYQQWLDNRGGNIDEGFVTFKTPKPGDVVTEFGGAYKNYPKIEVNPKHSQHIYLMKPHEQQVRMVRLGEIFKKHGSWDGTAKGLTDDVIKKAFKGIEEVPEDIRLLFGNIKGAKAGSKKWLEIVKKTIPYAWGMAPVAATQLKE